MVKQFCKDTPNSVWFWNILVVLVFILIWMLNKEISLVIYALINIPAFFMIFINLQDAKYDDSVKIIGYHYWVYLTPITWVLLAVAVVIFSISWLIVKVIEKVKQFNNWLNKK